MVTNVSDVLSVYKKSGGLLDDAASSSSSSPSGGPSFSSALQGFMGDAVGSLHQGEAAATQAVSGKADLASVVSAIDNAEVVLDEVVAIRDKVIAAYQSITSSAI